jgi:hypothetical protein
MPTVIRGWMQEAERLALRRWAFGLDVLEVGAYEGLSTVQLASTANTVTTVDTFDGRGTPEPRDTRDTFHANLQAAGLYHKVAIRPGESAEVLSRLIEQDYAYDLVFIDGSHDYDSVALDAALGQRLLRPDGALVFHDYDDAHPGVVQAVDALCADCFVPAAQENSLVMLRRGPAPAARKVNVAVVLPHRDGWGNIGAAFGVSAWCSEKLNRQVYNRGTSVLTRTFNELLCDALNDRKAEGFTHFAMLHNDVIPQRWWLDILLEELEARDLDLISAVVPIKDQKGLTSTGLDDPDNPWSVRRLTLTEVFGLPETFTARDIPGRREGQALLLNTGCWLMRFDRPWVEGLFFRQQDRIAWHTPSGKYVAQSISEDWDFSRQLASRGCRLGATRKVIVQHDRPEFHNRAPWGEWTEDRAYLEQHEEAARAEAAETTEGSAP